MLQKTNPTPETQEPTWLADLFSPGKLTGVMMIAIGAIYMLGMSGIDLMGFTGSNPKGNRVEKFNILDKSAPFGIAGPHRPWILVVVRIGIPAFGRDLHNSIYSFHQILPEFHLSLRILSFPLYYPLLFSITTVSLLKRCVFIRS